MKYFQGVDDKLDAGDKYDDFFGMVIKVKYISVLSFAEHVQQLLVEYICYVLE